MSVIQRYMLRQLVVVAALVTLTLTLAIWLTQSLRFVELIVNRGLSLQSYLSLTLLLLPSFLSLMLPVALFTGTSMFVPKVPAYLRNVPELLMAGPLTLLV